MKSLVLFSCLLLLDVSLASPISTFNTIVEDPSLEHRWELVPDGANRLHLIDLAQVEPEPIEPTWDVVQDTIFLLFTRQNPTVGQQIHPNLASIQNSNFNPSHPTRVTIHGWTRDRADPLNIRATEAYLRLGNFNMITVDWGVGAGSPNYITSRDRVGPTGARVAHMIDFLHQQNFVRFPDLHVIGHSLGGHMAGFVGKHTSRGDVQVITSLDPAGPLFYLNQPHNRVHYTDGVYVEVMHTNSAAQGFREPLGDCDFYPNGGQNQPGCGLDPLGTCAHARTTDYYVESVHTTFSGCECSTLSNCENGVCTSGLRAIMGGPNPNINQRGNFFLETNAQAPFSRG